MKKRLQSLMLAIIMVFIMYPGTVSAGVESEKTDNNEETIEEGALVISTLEDLEAFRDNVNAGESYKGVTVILDADIDMRGKYDANIGNKEVSWTPIGFYDTGNSSRSKVFKGTFDGRGHKITLYIHTSTLGLKYQGLFGYISGTVKNLDISGSVYVTGDEAGNVVGYNDGGRIENCHNMGEVVRVNSFANNVGGIVGYNDGGIIENCYNTGEIISDSGFVGGIAGNNNGGIIKNCYNTGDVSGNSHIGGIAGRDSGTIEDCHNTGDVSGSYDDIGGITGTKESGTIGNCYNRGNISCSGYSYSSASCIGGIAGVNEGTSIIKNSYNMGKVDGGEVNSIIGGVVGDTSSVASIVTDCYNMGDVSGTNAGGVIGRNYGGTIEKCHNTGNVSGDKNVGGLAALSGGILENCYNEGAVSSSGDYEGRVGGVVGDNTNKVTNCYNVGNVSGGSGSIGGGIAGRNLRGIIEKCYNEGVVTFEATVGGLVGMNYSPVVDCYNIGEIISVEKNSNGHVGGIVGFGGYGSEVENCYNMGRMTSESRFMYGVGAGQVKNCYYLKGIGISSVMGVDEDISAEAFNQKSTFAGWDFNSIWKMSMYLKRPVLQVDTFTYDVTENEKITAAQMKELLKQNKRYDVEIKLKNDVTFTFEKRSMAVKDIKDYDFGVEITEKYDSDGLPASIEKNDFVIKMDYNHSGELPAMAAIRIPVGRKYTGKAVCYSILNKDGTAGKRQGAVVDKNGYVTVIQNTCATAAITLLKLGDTDGNGIIESKDALCILKDVVGLEQDVFLKEVGDCDKDGEISSKDALMVLKHVVGIIELK